MDTNTMIFMILGYLLTAAVLVSAIPLAGWLLDKVVSFILSIASGIVGGGIVRLILRWLTFPGVIIHELSHALMAVITGAKVTKIVFFKPEGSRLGYVKYIPRGPKLMKAVQCTLTSMGPVLLGGLSLWCGYQYVKYYGANLSTAGFCLLAYLAFSIVCHMTMSEQDYKVMWKGIPVVYLIILVIVMVCRISVVEWFVGL